MSPERDRRSWLGTAGVLAILTLVVLAGLGVFGREGGEGHGAGPGATAAPTPSRSPRQLDYRDVGYDLTYKADLVERLPAPPEFVVLGGSRAQRFEPPYITRRTGLSAFNFAVQNCRPEDAYAILRFLYSRAPKVRVRCLFAVQATTFNDTVMHPGLLYDPRFRRFFPRGLLAAQRKASEPLRPHRLPSTSRYSPRGCILYNSYDRQRERGRTLERSLQIYLHRMVPRAASREVPGQERSLRYFRKFLDLCNRHDVVPAIVIMPYHPEALAAFRAVGWERKQRRLRRLLAGLADEYEFRVLDYTDIAAFGGRPEWFYDGAHVTKENSRRIIDQALRDAPECFR